MGISRRTFLKAVAVAPFMQSQEPPEHNFETDESLLEPVYRNNKLSILQGPTSDTVTQLSVDLPKSTKATYVLTDIASGKRMRGDFLGSATRSHSFFKVEQVRFSGLQLGHDYLFSVLDKKGRAIDERVLRPLDINKLNPRIGLMSCMFEFNVLAGTMWKTVQHTNCDVMFFLGDNVYADFLSTLNSPKIMWYRYINTRRMLPFYHWPELVPTFAIWDDHDYGANNVGGTYKHREHSIRTFNEFYAQKEIPGFYEKGPGIASAVSMFEHDFIFLDGRWFRGLPTSKNDKGFIGDEQMNWIKPKIAGNRPLWMSMGSQFFSPEKKGDSFEANAPAEFAELHSWLSAANRPVILSSGDIHYSEIQQIKREQTGFSAFELTSSSLHSIPDVQMPKNPRRVKGALKENFIFVDIKDPRGAYEATCAGIKDKTRFNYKFNF